ncbi:hypothetical protein VP1G_10827 [Cytospora mali]|uniref:Uncharacterized protein n=1 Tax=Cytospora mali TaxID=578113 RepID=A0A194UY99_CYTMA|nr:hypothetical protein VP1G_10827 [Valsa mali var. pyri (nom. inval.)]
MVSPERLKRLENTLDGSAKVFGPSMPTQDMSPPTNQKGSVGTMPDIPPQLKGEVQGPREDPGGKVSSPFIPEFMRKRKETTHLISDKVFRRHLTTPGESTLSSASGTKSPPPLQRPMPTNRTNSRRGDTGEGSLLCSPLPSPFRRERSASESQSKEPIGIFEGLVKPGSYPPYLLRPDQSKIRDGSKSNKFLTGDMMLDSDKGKSKSRLPMKLRGLSIRRDKKKRSPGETSSDEASSSNHTPKLSKPHMRARKPEGEPQPEH